MGKTNRQLLCKHADIASSCNMSTHNVSTSYVRKERKQKMLNVLDMGSYCVINNITHSELKVFVSLSIEMKRQLIEKMKELSL